MLRHKSHADAPFAECGLLAFKSGFPGRAGVTRQPKRCETTYMTALLADGAQWVRTLGRCGLPGLWLRGIPIEVPAPGAGGVCSRWHIAHNGGDIECMCYLSCQLAMEVQCVDGACPVSRPTGGGSRSDFCRAEGLSWGGRALTHLLTHAHARNITSPTTHAPKCPKTVARAD